ARFNTKFRKELYDVNDETIRLLESFHWPGNIRQLENVLQQGVLVSSGHELLPEHLPPHIQETAPSIAVNGEVPSTNNGHPNAELRKEHHAVVERSVILRALQNHGYSRARAANALGISRVTLYKKMKKYGLMNTARAETN